MIKQFDRVKLSEKKIKYDLRLPFKNRKKRPAFKSQNVTFPTNYYPIRVYSENNKIYVYCSDKYVYELNNGTFTRTEMELSLQEPTLITVENDGVKKVIKAPFGKDALFLSGRLIILDTEKIYISKKISIGTFNLVEEDFSVIGMSDEEGEIYGMLKSGDNLLVLTEKSLYKISRIDGDIMVKRISTVSFKPTAKTFARCENRACFLSGDKLCVIENDRIKVKKTALDGTSISVADRAGTAQNTYLLPLYLGGGSVMFIYDLESNENQVVSEYLQALSKDNGYVIGGGILKKFYNEYYEAGVFGTMPDPEDMGTCKIKTVTEIEACVKGTASLRINGDFGEKIVKLKDGCNVFRVNLTSKRFTFSTFFSSVGFTIEEITLKYTVHEESKNAI